MVMSPLDAQALTAWCLGLMVRAILEGGDGAWWAAILWLAWRRQRWGNDE